MKHGIRSTAAFGAALLAFGCSDAEKGVAPTAPEFSSVSSTQVSSEKAALSELTRITAFALNNQGLRQRIKNDLRESRHTREHKLQFSTYLNGQSGGILLAKMAKESGKTREEILALLDQVRPLEFYMPVEEHRGTWQGGGSLWVASYLEDDGSELPAVYDVRGNPAPLWAPDALPGTPTLALVPVETNFAKELDPATFVNKNDQGGQTIGTYVQADETVSPSYYEEPCDPYAVQECDDGGGSGGGGGGGGTTYAPGLWMTYANALDGVEDGLWGLKSSPEIEVHVFGAATGDPSQAASLSCSDAEAYGSYRFDMNDHDWSGNVLIFGQQQIDSYNARTADDYAIMMWEDDDGRCQVKTDKNLGGLMKIIYDTYQSNAVKTKDGISVDFGKLLKVLWQNASWLKSNDEFIGNARKVAPGTYSNATHKLERSASDYNGKINLIRR